MGLMVSEKTPQNESEAWFRTLLDSAPDAMIIVNDNGEIEIVSRQAEQMFGYSRDELRGQKIEILMPDRIRQRHLKHRAGFIEQPSVRPMGASMELVARRKDGSEFPVEISLSPVALGANRFTSSVIRDVTERKKMEQQIIAAQKAAERATKANSAFLAAASHDLRQPVQALSLLNGALRRTVKDERALEMIEHQEHSLTAMTNLLNSLLDISRLDAGAIKPEFEEFPMQRLIDRLSAEFSRQAKHNGLDFNVQPCHAMVRSDPNLLSEIIQNFVSNAIRYTDSGSVNLRCVEADGYCLLEVQDTGVGIADDQLEAIFKEFHQVKTAGSNKEGFGLGLAIVKRMADLLGYAVSVQSTPGQGSCFTLKVPILTGAIANTASDASSEGPIEHAASGLIILIEDDADVANAWRLLLQAEGYQVAMAATASEANVLIRQISASPALVISDFHLRDGSTGVEAVAEIRDYCAESLPAFIVSGDTSKVVKDARLLDNCTLMSKPVNTARLLSAARIAIRTGQVPPD